MRPSKRKYSKYPTRPVKDRKKAIAIGRAKARRKGAKIPAAPSRRAA
jgi:hypothetical protein